MWLIEQSLWEADMEWTGGCLCGAVRYEITGPPLRGTICHCSLCRKSSGSAFQAWALFRKEQLSWTQGTPHIIQATPLVIRKFCHHCGSPLSFQFRDDHSDQIIGVTIGTLDTPNDVAPTRHNWVSEQLNWLNIIDELPRNLHDAGDETDV
jgi:hypothetical protein